MNKVILMGRLTRDPNVSISAGGEGSMTIARYTLAVDRMKRQGEEKEADFISCVAFGKNGEFAEMYLKQGSKIAIEGHIQTGSYTNKEGNKVYTTDVIVERHEFCESRGTQGTAAKAESAPNPANDGFMSIADGVDDEGLPFN